MFSLKNATISVFALLSVTLAMMILSTTPSRADGEFNHPTVGTFLLDFGTGQQMVASHSDGTFVAGRPTSDSAPGDGVAGFGGAGTWVKTGARTTAFTSLSFQYLDDGVGPLAFIGRVRGTAVADSMDTGSGRFFVDIYLPGMDPLSDDPVFTSGPFTYTARRVNVLPAD